MSKSSCIRAWKNKIMSELSQDDAIIEALGLNPDESPDDLVWVWTYLGSLALGSIFSLNRLT